MDQWLGKKATLRQCAEAVKRAGGKFFIYGKGRKARNCFVEKTRKETCPEGWERDQYNFFKLGSRRKRTIRRNIRRKIRRRPIRRRRRPRRRRKQSTSYSLVKSNVECKSRDQWLGKKATVRQCAEAVRRAGGKFFIYGKG